MKSKMEIFDETVQYYSEDTSRRAKGIYDDDDKCFYYIDGKTCAVGRCLKTPKRFEGFIGTILSLEKRAKDSLDELFKEEYKGHSYFFWEELQGFHDSDFNWDKNGLTEQGKIEVNNFKKNILNGLYE